MPNRNNPSLLRRRVDDSTMINGLICPVKRALCTFEFADPDYPNHRGVDFVSVGTEFSDPRQTRHFFTAGSDGNCYAAFAGEVVETRTGVGNLPISANSLGNFVRIRDSRGNIGRYAHLASVSVRKGDTVRQGQTIGVIGNSGSSNGRHLHFDYNVNRTMIDTLRARNSQSLTTKGDVNGDGTIGIDDVLAILQHLSGIQRFVPNSPQWIAASILSDTPSISDVLEILMYLAGLDSALGKCNQPLLKSYRVQSGDSLSRIADREQRSGNMVTVDDIMEINPSITNRNQISVGQEIFIPINTKTANR
jgi:hypothetical protein